MNLEQLKSYANLRGLNLGQAEKDYYQNMILFILYNKTSKELVFKGGTALAKCYGLNRFSEDLDFTVTNEKNFIDIINKGLDEFSIKHTVKEIRTSGGSKKYKIKIEGILHKGTERTSCSITLDFSLREKTLIEPEISTIGYHMDIIPVFEVYVMKKKEIMAEKVRAILTRKSARDLYDLVFLIKSGTTVGEKMIKEKLKYYKLDFNKAEIIKKSQSIESIWKSELKSLVRNVPDFSQYITTIQKDNWIR